MWHVLGYGKRGCMACQRLAAKRAVSLDFRMNGFVIAGRISESGILGTSQPPPSRRCYRHVAAYRFIIVTHMACMGKVTIITESVLAYCDNCGKEFTPRIRRKLHTCPACRTAVTGAEDVPLRGDKVNTEVDRKIE